MESAAKNHRREPSSGAGPAATGVGEQLRTIDASSLDELLQLRKEEVRLKEFLTRANGMRDKAPDGVFRRVVDDYTARLTGLNDKAAPLRAKVRTEYQKLRALIDQVRGARERAESEQAEIQFRHAVGELTDAARDAGLRPSAEALESSARDLREIEQQQQRFLSAFDSEAELNVQADTLAQPHAAAQATPQQPPHPPTSTAKPSTARTDNPNATVGVADNALSAAVGRLRAEALGSEHTLLAPSAGLLIHVEGAPPLEYKLTGRTCLGRADENQVKLTGLGVSRQHACISSAIGGFVIKDSQSQNGTFVNGERIIEERLKDGDEIEIGDRKVVFRTPWPVVK